MNEGKPALFFYSFLFLIQVLIVAHVIKVPIFQKETVFNEMSLLCVCVKVITHLQSVWIFIDSLKQCELSLFFSPVILRW